MFSFNQQTDIRTLLDAAQSGHPPTNAADREVLAKYLDGLIAHYEIWTGGQALDMRKLRDVVIGGLRPPR